MAPLGRFPRKLYARVRRPLARSRLGQRVLRWSLRGRPSFHCPICGYRGHFLTHWGKYEQRPLALCPECGSAERHRLQFLVLERVALGRDLAGHSILHVAPETCMRSIFQRRFGRYVSLDMHGRRPDYRADLRQLPFADAVFDVVFASHVLEHVPEDQRAIAEIARVLRPAGLAVLPVPILGPKTVEYGAPNPHESGHVRAPGLDYFDRYRPHFRRVDLYESGRFPAEFQLYVHEDRSSWPPTMPQRPTMAGTRHSDFVPVCVR
jgi:SAM-dependent methyltransferase